jgi:hypothetical protein
MGDNTPAFGVKFKPKAKTLPRITDGVPTALPVERSVRSSVPPETAAKAPPLKAVWIPAANEASTTVVGRPPSAVPARPAPAVRAMPENAYGVIDQKLLDDPPRPPGTAYQMALDFTVAVHHIVELADTERYHLKDVLDKKAVQIATGMAQAANDPMMSGRRASYKAMQIAVVECGALLDVVARRGTVEPDLIEPARKLASDLIEKLEVLSTPPRRYG